MSNVAIQTEQRIVDGKVTYRVVGWIAGYRLGGDDLPSFEQAAYAATVIAAEIFKAKEGK